MHCHLLCLWSTARPSARQSQYEICVTLREHGCKAVLLVPPTVSSGIPSRGFQLSNTVSSCCMVTVLLCFVHFMASSVFFCYHQSHAAAGACVHKLGAQTQASVLVLSYYTCDLPASLGQKLLCVIAYLHIMVQQFRVFGDILSLHAWLSIDSSSWTGAAAFVRHPD